MSPDPLLITVWGACAPNEEPSALEALFYTVDHQSDGVVVTVMGLPDLDDPSWNFIFE